MLGKATGGYEVVNHRHVRGIGALVTYAVENLEVAGSNASLGGLYSRQC